MIKIQLNSDHYGFTLIETIMAMAIFTIGLLGLFGMQTAAINENLAANSITTGSSWATYQVEYLLGLSYTHDDLTVNTTCDVFQDSDWWEKGKGTQYAAEDDPLYDLYWAVANNCTLSGIANAADEEQEQKPKYLQIIVVKEDSGEKVAIFNYIKQNVQIK